VQFRKTSRSVEPGHARYQEFDTIDNAQLASDAAAVLADRIGPTVALTMLRLRPCALAIWAAPRAPAETRAAVKLDHRRGSVGFLIGIVFPDQFHDTVSVIENNR
jgi:hypothetical protein